MARSQPVRSVLVAMVSLGVVFSCLPSPVWAAPPRPASATITPMPLRADRIVVAERRSPQGDLTEALEAAQVARQAEPTAERWAAEARALEALGRYAEAVEAWRDALDSGSETFREDVAADVARAEALARGRVDDEPASTARARLDDARAQPEGRALAAPIDTRPPPSPSQEVRLTRQWYFWVTVGALAAAAGTIAGLAIQAATNPGGVDDRRAVAPPPRPPAPGPAVFRF